MKYKTILNSLNEDATRLPPVDQSWHDFDRAFFSNSSMNFTDFIEDYMEYYSSVRSFFADSDNSTLRKTVDDMGIRFIEAIEQCTGDSYSVICEKIARCL